MSMRVFVDKGIFAQYPKTQIGFVVATLNQNPDPKVIDTMVSKLKGLLLEKGFQEGKPVQQDPRIAIWRNTFNTFGVKGSEIPSSVEALTKRAFKEQFPRILPAIDLYNAHSVASLLPMGGYDLNKVIGDVSIQHAKVAGHFLGIGSKEPVAVDPKHVVYQDEEGVICWLWNHKDAARTSITADTKEAIFFFDCVDPSIPGTTPMQQAIEGFWNSLIQIGAKPQMNGILSASQPEKRIRLSAYSPLDTFQAEQPLSSSNEMVHIQSNGAPEETIRLLRQHPMSIFQMDGNNQSLLMHAAAGGWDLIFNYVLFQLNRLEKADRITLEQKMKFLNNTSVFGETALHTATRHHRLEMAKHLLDAGCDRNSINTSGLTPKQLALEKGHFDMAEIM